MPILNTCFLLQGFASGDVDKDAFCLRQYVVYGHLLVLHLSYIYIYISVLGSCPFCGRRTQALKAFLLQA